MRVFQFRTGCDSRASSATGTDTVGESPRSSVCGSPAFGGGASAVTAARQNTLLFRHTEQRQLWNSKPVASGNGGGVEATKSKTALPSPDKIDRLLGAPDKISIPDRLMPEAEDARPTAEEAARRQEKVEAIRRMLGEGVAAESSGGGGRPDTVRLLTLNQLIAQQVKARSRSLAVAAAASKKKDGGGGDGDGGLNDEEDHRSDSSPDIPLPMRQQRESFLI
jgi:hypothetical protein